MKRLIATTMLALILMTTVVSAASAQYISVGAPISPPRRVNLVTWSGSYYGQVNKYNSYRHMYYRTFSVPSAYRTTVWMRYEYDTNKWTGYQSGYVSVPWSVSFWIY